MSQTTPRLQLRRHKTTFGSICTPVSKPARRTNVLIISNLAKVVDVPFFARNCNPLHTHNTWVSLNRFLCNVLGSFSNDGQTHPVVFTTVAGTGVEREITPSKARGYYQSLDVPPSGPLVLAFPPLGGILRICQSAYCRHEQFWGRAVRASRDS